ncbi:hypothetical protein GPECTOR_65g196 [Gonium pectorale]|uniref:Uncharacterized protein n=1 Tax=Gonium pectorale TaxID=33097 RepID=A0A150G422_GONPE|nr:hypothetical protein GPECTOR_65g196 [Gonium pectorale]|eukprot:KXZ44578.1 hypothetical protein GPECTOR_65g196 [Gonium pectorale]
MMTILNGQLAKVATKDDLANLEVKMSAKVPKLEADISKLPTEEDRAAGANAVQNVYQWSWWRGYITRHAAQ